MTIQRNDRILINLGIHLQESQIAAAKFTKKVCKCEDKRLAMDREVWPLPPFWF